MKAASSLESILSRTRNNLLDLSLRNRLLNTPRTATRSKRLDIVDERSDEVFRILVHEEKPMRFLASKEECDVETGNARPEERGVIDNEVVERHFDTLLQTTLTPPNLQKRLLSLHSDARTMEEEQGVSILYLSQVLLLPESGSAKRWACSSRSCLAVIRASRACSFVIAIMCISLPTG